MGDDVGGLVQVRCLLPVKTASQTSRAQVFSVAITAIWTRGTFASDSPPPSSLCARVSGRVRSLHQQGPPIPVVVRRPPPCPNRHSGREAYCHSRKGTHRRPDIWFVHGGGVDIVAPQHVPAPATMKSTQGRPATSHRTCVPRPPCGADRDWRSIRLQSACTGAAVHPRRYNGKPQPTECIYDDSRPVFLPRQASVR